MRRRTTGDDGRVGGRVAKAVGPFVVVAAILLMPVTVAAQRSGDAANIAARLAGLQQQLAELSARLEQLKIQDQQLQRRLEEMRTNVEARLERLEKAGAGARRR
jgi:TolA-binding protein